jgi:hypothetical protein
LAHETGSEAAHGELQLEKITIRQPPFEEFAFERKIVMDVLHKILFFMAAAITIWAAAMWPGTLSRMGAGSHYRGR